jgi:hypothetical protein
MISLRSMAGGDTDCDLFARPMTVTGYIRTYTNRQGGEIEMPRIKRKCWSFYLLGREERRLRHDVDPEDVAKRILAQDDASLTDELVAACQGAAEKISPRVQKNWLADHDDEIKEAGVDHQEAYQAWLAGRVDELARVLEPHVVGAVSDEVFEEEG